MLYDRTSPLSKEHGLPFPPQIKRGGGGRMLITISERMKDPTINRMWIIQGELLFSIGY